MDSPHHKDSDFNKLQHWCVVPVVLTAQRKNVRFYLYADIITPWPCKVFVVNVLVNQSI